MAIFLFNLTQSAAPCVLDCDILTIGQYFAPSKKHHPVIEYIHPNQFEKYRKIGMDLEFKFVASAPLIRNSYHAGEVTKAI